MGDRDGHVTRHGHSGNRGSGSYNNDARPPGQGHIGPGDVAPEYRYNYDTRPPSQGHIGSGGEDPSTRRYDTRPPSQGHIGSGGEDPSTRRYDTRPPSQGHIGSGGEDPSTRRYDTRPPSQGHIGPGGEDPSTRRYNTRPPSQGHIGSGGEDPSTRHHDTRPPGQGHIGPGGEDASAHRYGTRPPSQGHIGSGGGNPSGHRYSSNSRPLDQGSTESGGGWSSRYRGDRPRSDDRTGRRSRDYRQTRESGGLHDRKRDRDRTSSRSARHEKSQSQSTQSQNVQTEAPSSKRSKDERGPVVAQDIPMPQAAQAAALDVVATQQTTSEMTGQPQPNTQCRFEVAGHIGKSADYTFEQKKMPAINSNRDPVVSHGKRIKAVSSTEELPEFKERVYWATKEGAVPVNGTKIYYAKDRTPRHMALTMDSFKRRDAGLLSLRIESVQKVQGEETTKDQQAMAMSGREGQWQPLMATEEEGREPAPERAVDRTAWMAHMKAPVNASELPAEEDKVRSQSAVPVQRDAKQWTGTFIEAGQFGNAALEMNFRYSMMRPNKPMATEEGAILLNSYRTNEDKAAPMLHEAGPQLRRDMQVSENIRRDTLNTLSHKYTPLAMSPGDIRAIQTVVEAIKNNPTNWATRMMELGFVRGIYGLDQQVSHALAFMGLGGGLEMAENPMFTQAAPNQTPLEGVVRARAAAETETLTTQQTGQLINIGRATPYAALDGHTRYGLKKEHKLTRGAEQALLRTLPSSNEMMRAGEHKQQKWFAGGLRYRDEGLTLLSEKEIIGRTGRVYETNALRDALALIQFQGVLEVDRSKIKTLVLYSLKIRSLYDSVMRKKDDEPLRQPGQVEIQDTANIDSPVVACPWLPSPELMTPTALRQARSLVEGQLGEFVYMEEPELRTFRAFVVMLYNSLETRGGKIEIVDAMEKVQMLIRHLGKLLHDEDQETPIAVLETVVQATVLSGNWSYNRLLKAMKIVHGKVGPELEELPNQGDRLVLGPRGPVAVLQKQALKQAYDDMFLHQSARRDIMPKPHANTEQDNKRCGVLFRAPAALARDMFEAQRCAPVIRDGLSVLERAEVHVRYAFDQVAPLYAAGRDITLEMCDKELAMFDEQRGAKDRRSFVSRLLHGETLEQPVLNVGWTVGGLGSATKIMARHVERTLGFYTKAAVTEQDRVWNFMHQVFTVVKGSTRWPLDIGGAMFATVCEICPEVSKLHAQLTLMVLTRHSAAAALQEQRAPFEFDTRGLLMAGVQDLRERDVQVEVWATAHVQQHTPHHIRLVSRLPGRNPAVQALFHAPADIHDRQRRRALGGIWTELTYCLHVCWTMTDNEAWKNKAWDAIIGLSEEMSAMIEAARNATSTEWSAVNILGRLARLSEVLRKVTARTNTIIGQYLMGMTFMNGEEVSTEVMWQVVENVQLGRISYEAWAPLGVEWDLDTQIETIDWTNVTRREDAPLECKKAWLQANEPVRAARSQLPQTAVQLAQYIDRTLWRQVQKVSAWSVPSIMHVLRRAQADQEWSMQMAMGVIDGLAASEGQDTEFRVHSLDIRRGLHGSDLFRAANYEVQDRRMWMAGQQFLSHAVVIAPVFSMMVRGLAPILSLLAVAGILQQDIVYDRLPKEICTQVVVGALAHCGAVQEHWRLPEVKAFARRGVVQKRDVAAILFMLKDDPDMGDAAREILKGQVRLSAQESLFDSPEEALHRDKVVKTEEERRRELELMEQQEGLQSQAGWFVEGVAKELLHEREAEKKKVALPLCAAVSTISAGVKQEMEVIAPVAVTPASPVSAANPNAQSLLESMDITAATPTATSFATSSLPAEDEFHVSSGAVPVETDEEMNRRIASELELWLYQYQQVRNQIGERISLEDAEQMATPAELRVLASIREGWGMEVADEPPAGKQVQGSVGGDGSSTDTSKDDEDRQLSKKVKKLRVKESADK